MSATTNTVIATVDAEVPTVPSTLITTAAILIAAKGKGYAKQVKNKMEKTKNTIVGNTTDCYTLVKELYSHSVMLLQQTLFQTENTTSGEEFSTSVGKLMDCIETLSGSIQQNIASLKKIKQKLAQNNKQYIAQSIEFAAIPVDESETTQPPAAKKSRAKKVKESVATEGGVDETAPAPKKPRAKKVKEPVATTEGGESAADATNATEATAPAPKKPRAKKVKESVVAAEPATDAETTPATDAAAAAPAPKKPRAKKVKEPSATEPAAAASEAPVTTEAEVAEAVAQAVIEAVEQAVAEAAAKKKPRAKKTKKSSETVATVASEDATTVTSESEQPQTETIYTVIHPEVTEDSTAPKKTKKTKEPKKTNKSKQTTEPPSTPIHNNADSMTPCAPVKENTTRESIIQNDFVPNHLTFDYEITSEDICRDIELIIDELEVEEDMISEITVICK
jgi:hypothetical protein